MSDSTVCARVLARRKPLAACVASLFALAAPLSCVVIDCGVGTLTVLRVGRRIPV